MRTWVETDPCIIGWPCIREKLAMVVCRHLWQVQRCPVLRLSRWAYPKVQNVCIQSLGKVHIGMIGLSLIARKPILISWTNWGVFPVMGIYHLYFIIRQVQTSLGDILWSESHSKRLNLLILTDCSHEQLALMVERRTWLLNFVLKPSPGDSSLPFSKVEQESAMGFVQWLIRWET